MEGFSGSTDLLTQYEIEHYIQELKVIEIQEYGSKDWYKQDEILQKLNMQAHINALIRSEEFIMENFATFDKIKPLIYDLLQCEIWKSNVFPLIKEKLSDLNSYRSYFSIYHEACVCNLLEIMFYHRTAVESAESYLLELIDYCYRKLLFALKNPLKEKKVQKKTVEEFMKRTYLEDFEVQKLEIDFSIAMMCISIIRFITDYIKYLPIGIGNHLLVDNDILCVLVPLIEEKPYLRTTINGEREVYDNSKWNLVAKNEYSKIAKLEGNIWVAIYNLFMDPECRKKYELNDFRKSNLLRLRKYMNELLLDQIPVLNPMLRSLEELNLMNVRAQTLHNTFIIQQMPELKEHIMKDKNWKEIADYQLKTFFTQDEKSFKEDMKKLADLYGQSAFEGLLLGYQCNKCNKDATKRCAKCKSVWYCSKDCQVADWKEHKKVCVLNEGRKEKVVGDNENKENVTIKEISSNVVVKENLIQDLGDKSESNNNNKNMNLEDVD